MKNLQTFEEFLNESLNESNDEIVFSIDDDKLDQMLNSKFSRQLDYKDDKGDSFYVLDRKDFDRFIDLADSSGFDVDYENSKDSVIAVQEALGHTEYIGENVNEATTDGTYIFFYATNLTNIDYRKIFKGWEIKGVAENLSRDWVAFAKPIKSIDKAEAEIESTIKKFPRENSITFQSGTYSNGKFELVKGSYREYGMETVFIKTLLELIEK